MARPDVSAPTAARPTPTGRARFRIRQYGFAVLAVLLTAAAQLVIPRPLLTIPLLIALLAIVLTAYFAGRGPALFATAANLLVNWYVFAEPRFSFAVARPADRWRLAIFAATGIGISVLSHRLRAMHHFPRMVLALSSTLLLVIVAVLVWFDFDNERAAQAWVEHTYQVLNASDELLAIVEHAEEQQRDYLLTGDQNYVRDYRQTLLATGPAMEKLRALTRDNSAQQSRIADARRLVGGRLEYLGEGILLRQQKGLAAAAQTALGSGPGRRQMDELRAELGAIEAEEHRLLTERTRATAVQASRTRVALAAGTAFLVVLLAAAGATIEKDVKKLEASARTLRLQADLLNKVLEPIFVWKLGGVIEYWNRGAEELYGFTSAQAIGREPHSLLHTRSVTGTPEIEQQLAREQKWQGELTHFARGREIIVDSFMTSVIEADGRITVLETNRDKTEEKRAQAEIRHLNEDLERRVQERTAQLEASNQELEAFAYSVSHDLRAPLRGIDGWSLALSEDYGSLFDATAREYLDRVRSETQRMGRLIDDLLQLSRLTRMPLERESVDLSSLARAIASRLRAAEPGRRMEFLVQDGLSSSGDSRLLEVVLTNLLSNSVKFTGPRDLARIEFGRMNSVTNGATNGGPGGAMEGAGKAAFFVRDNGVGFDMAHADMLFGAFQRMHRQSEFPGNGIGLATTQRIVRRHGGIIWAEAAPNRGATFYFTIPAGPSR